MSNDERKPAMIELSLGDKQSLVQSLWSIWDHGGALLRQLPQTIKAILETQAWRKREVDGKIFTNATFREFVISAPLKGCGWQNQIEEIEKVLGLQNPDVLRQWREAMTPAKHLHHDDDNVIINPEQGNSLSYTLDRLFRNHLELYARVIAGELSANAAAIEAGFRKRPPKRLKNCPHCGGEL